MYCLDAVIQQKQREKVTKSQLAESLIRQNQKSYYILLNTGKDKLVDNKVWENISAVKEGRLIQASSNMFWFNDILSLSKQIDIIANSILEK